MKAIPLDGGPVRWVGASHTVEVPGGRSPRRLPAQYEPQFDMMTAFAVSSPSGVRLAFRTDATEIELTSTPTVISLPDIGARPVAIDLVVDGDLSATVRAEGGTVWHIDPSDIEHMTIDEKGPAVHRFDGMPTGEKNVELWLPPAGDIAVIELRVSDGATVVAPEEERPAWVHYGSSISQCGEAHSPAGIWPAIAARAAGLCVTNLGLGGSCHLDQFVARHIRDLPADVISLKLGINVSNRASLIERTFVPAFHGFVDTVRDGHADTPIVVASPIICPSAEDRPGPSENVDGRFRAAGDPASIANGALTLRRIRELLAEGVAVRRAAGDDHIHYLDGLELFGARDVDDLPDDLHPNGDGYERIGERFAALVFGPDGLVPAT